MVSFWIRQDQQDSGLADAVAAAVDDWLRGEWPLTRHVFRVLPCESSSRAALERLGLRDDSRPYLWFEATA
jgi:RimJ/RimL family protein N-acetyltransferase